MKRDRQPSSSGALQEWRRDWPTPLVGMLGAGASTMHFSTFGLLIKPIMADTGWSLNVVTASSLIYSIIVVASAPVLGWLLDRLGAGRIAIFGLVAYLASFAAVGAFPHSPLQWYLAWALLSVAAIFSKSPVWVSPVAKRFDKSRGLALAVVGSGLGFYSIFIPSLTQGLVTHVGWRMTYAAIAGIVLVCVWPLVYIVLGRKDFDAVSDARAAARAPTGGLPGPTWQAALRSRYLWQMTAAALMGGMGVLSVQLHLASMLQEKAMAPATVAMVLGALGVSGLAGRFVTGHLLDRYSGRLVAAVAFLIPVLACLLYLRFDGGVISALVIVALFGFSAGAETDVMAFLAARYLGLRSFGVSFSLIYALQGLGGGGGPLLMSQLHGVYGGYDGAMGWQIAFLVVGALLFITLGRPPDYEAAAAPSPTPTKIRKRSAAAPLTAPPN